MKDLNQIFQKIESSEDQKLNSSPNYPICRNELIISVSKGHNTTQSSAINSNIFDFNRNAYFIESILNSTNFHEKEAQNLNQNKSNKNIIIKTPNTYTDLLYQELLLKTLSKNMNIKEKSVIKLYENDKIFLGFINFDEKVSKLIIKLIPRFMNYDMIYNFLTKSKSNHPFSFDRKQESISVLLYSTDAKTPREKIFNAFMETFINPIKNLQKSNAEVILSGIRSMGFKNTKKNEESDKTTYLYAINDNGNDCESEWSTFPVLLTVCKGVIGLEIIFAVNSKPGVLTGPYLAKAIEFIKKVNNLLCNSVFFYNPRSKFILYKTSIHTMFPPYLNYDFPQILTSEAVSLYTAFAHGIYCIYTEMINSNKNKDISSQENQILYTVNELLSICKKRSHKPIMLFTLHVNDDAISISHSLSVTSKELEKEQSIISVLKADDLLKKVFQTEKIYSNSQGVITYPKILIGSTFDSNKKQIITTRCFEAMKKVGKKLLKGRLDFKIENFFKMFLLVKENVYYNFLIPLHDFFQYFDKNSFHEKLIIFYKHLAEVLEEEIMNSLWNVEDLFLIGLDDSVKYGKYAENYFGLKIKKEIVILPHILKCRDSGIVISKKDIKICKDLTAIRYRMNQVYFNEYVCRYLGLINSITIAVEDADHFTIEEIVEIKKELKNNNIEDKEVKSLIAKRAAEDYIDFENKLICRNLRQPLYIPSKTLISYSPKIKILSQNTSAKNTIFHIIPIKEINLCHNHYKHFFTITREDKLDEKLASKVSFVKNIVYFLTLNHDIRKYQYNRENTDKDILLIMELLDK